MDGKRKRRPMRFSWLSLSVFTLLCLACVEADSGGTPVGESQYLIGPDGDLVYYRTPDGSDGFLQIDFTVASDSVVSEADVESFELLPDSLVWARDDDSVFFAGDLVRSADPSTFSPFEENPAWGRDKETVYYGRSVVEGADPGTFELLGSGADGWARDVEHIYRNGERVEGLDSATFGLLDGGYYHDQNALYYRGEAVDGANLSALQARASIYGDDANLAWDDHQLWFNGHPVTVRRNDGSIGVVDVDTLAATHTDTVLADADGVYGRLIEHADRPAHFYQIDLVNPAAFVGGATHKDDLLSFTLQTADATSLGAYDARELLHSLVRLGIYEITPGADVERLGCGYWRRDSRVFYHGVLVEGQAPDGFSPEDEAGECRTETWLLDIVEEFQD